MTTIGLIGAGTSQPDRETGSGTRLCRCDQQLARAGHLVRTRRRAGTERACGDAGRRGTGRGPRRVTVPLKNYRQVPVEPLAGKVVIDTNNYYPERDGHIPELDNESTTTSELLQAHLPTSKVVKAFNHIYAAQLTTDGRPPGAPHRRRWSLPATIVTRR